MSNEQKLRDAFEARMTDNGKWPRAVEQGRNGCYLLAQTENAWVEWQACAEALATTEPEPAVPQGEPFGYFRVDALGWTDCAATDEGAIALYERPAAPAVPDTHISVQEAWEAAGGNPGIKASKADLIIALKTLDTVCDEADAAPAVPQGWKPVGYLRSAEFDGHVFEPIDGTWPFDELLFSLCTSPEPVQEVTLTDEEIKRNWSGGACPPWGIKFARAIIAAMREKEALR